jgi:branched-subunit amino acid ABC-type transport system permease component
MALHYHTEYRLGDRGRICRSYTGFQAFVAIGLDLVFGLFFELVFSLAELAMRIAVLTARFVVHLLRITWRILVAAMTVIVFAATLPFVWVHEAVDRLRSRGTDEGRESCVRSQSAAKPSWALSREV